MAGAPGGNAGLRAQAVQNVVRGAKGPTGVKGGVYAGADVNPGERSRMTNSRGYGLHERPERVRSSYPQNSPPGTRRQGRA